MKIEVIVCDKCGDPSRPAKEFTVSSDGRTGTTDRCAEHGAELEEVLPPAEAPKSRGGRRRMQAVSLDDVERAKRQK